MRKPSVLVVDDKASMVGLVVRVLEDLAQVVAAGSVREALAVLQRESVDAIVCDLRLPDGDGLEVLLMTAFASVETAVQALTTAASRARSWRPTWATD